MADSEMEIFLHQLARETGLDKLRLIADRLAELAGKERSNGHIQ